MSLQLRKPVGPGVNKMVDGEMKMLGFSVIRLGRGEGYEEALKDKELCFVLLSGSCDVKAGSIKRGIGPRKDVFSDPAWAVYVPAGEKLSIKSSSDMEASLIYAPGEKGLEPRVIEPGELNIMDRGRPGFQRKVVDILASNVDATHLVVGETFNLPGQWSSYPPHCHERDIPEKESKHEELYFFRFNPENGFGFMRIYTDDRSLDEPMALQHNDLVMIPRGYHPVASAPGYTLYYLWMLAGPTRNLVMRDDPEHAWVKDA